MPLDFGPGAFFFVILSRPSTVEPSWEFWKECLPKALEKVGKSF